MSAAKDVTKDRLTDAEIRATVAAMPMRADHKRVLLAQALAGHASARFVIAGAYARQHGARR